MNVQRQPKLQRSTGHAVVSFKAGLHGTVLDDLYQQGCSKVRFPKSTNHFCEAVLLNTAGGMTDGDTVETDIRWRANTFATATTQAAERIYKSRAGVAKVRTTLTVESNSVACWLPQETILFDAAGLQREISIDVAADSHLFAMESLVFGRRAMGEEVVSGFLADRWRIRVGGRLVFAEHFLIDSRQAGPIQNLLERAAVANGRACMATVVYVAADCAASLSSLREITDGSAVIGGVTDLGPMLVARLLTEDSRAMRAALMQMVDTMGNRLNNELPRVWQC